MTLDHFSPAAVEEHGPSNTMTPEVILREQRGEEDIGLARGNSGGNACSRKEFHSWKQLMPEKSIKGWV